MMVLGLTEKQQEFRRTGIGASEVAQIVGLVPGAIDVWASKVGLAAADEPSTLTEFGHRIERTIADAWLDRHRDEGVRIYTPGTLRHPKHAWAIASPDRVVALNRRTGRPAREDWIRDLEIKTVFFSGSEYGESGTDEVPERYLVQVAWQLAVTDLQEATLVALVNGDYREFPIRRDLELEGMLIEQVGRWWRDYVVANVAPPVDGSAAYSAYLKRRYPSDLAPPLNPTPELEALVKRVRETRAAKVEATEAEAAASNALKSALGPASGIDRLCTYRNNKPSLVVDWERMARAFYSAAVASAQDKTAIVPFGYFEKQFTHPEPGNRVLRLSKEK